MKSKAAIQVEYGGRWVIEEIDIPDPGPNQVTVRNFASGVCYSQVHQLRNPSHRRSGVVVAGLDVERHHIGIGAGDRTPTARRLPVGLLAEQRLAEPVKLGDNLLRCRTYGFTGSFV